SLNDRLKIIKPDPGIVEFERNRAEDATDIIFESIHVKSYLVTYVYGLLISNESEFEERFGLSDMKLEQRRTLSSLKSVVRWASVKIELQHVRPEDCDKDKEVDLFKEGLACVTDFLQIGIVAGKGLENHSCAGIPEIEIHVTRFVVGELDEEVHASYVFNAKIIEALVDDDVGFPLMSCNVALNLLSAYLNRVEHSFKDNAIFYFEMAQPDNNNTLSSALKTFFEREKLTGDNFNDWYRSLRIVLRVTVPMTILYKPCPDEPPAKQQRMHFELYFPQAMLNELRKMFEKPTAVEIYDLVDTLHSCKQAPVSKEYERYVFSVWREPDTELNVTGFCDASWQSDKDDTKSQTGYVFIVNEGAVDWKSKKQTTIAMSATQAEYMAASEAAMEAVWIRKFVGDLGVMPSIKKPIDMYCDNSAAIIFANDSGVMKGARHFLRR
ncbi:hypothetical protein Tco_0675128, partial [Tanacetum coccineum]